MANNTKNIPVVKEIPIIQEKENTQKILTVVVLDDKNKPTEGASVSITPSDAQSITNNLGEVQFKLGSDTRYQVTASYGSKKVTVPYYVTKDGATRLVVNPTYVRTIEKQLHPYALSNIDFLPFAGIGLGLIVLFFVIRRLLFLIRRKRRIKNRNSGVNKN